MITYIDIFTGFLESGKTTLINDLINNQYYEDFEDILLIVCEEGLVEYDEDELDNNNIKMVVVESEIDLTDEFLKNIEKKYDPELIVIEYNGMWDISRILGLELPRGYKYRNVMFVSEAKNFRNQLANMPTVLQPHILNSDVVIFNRFDKDDKETKSKLKKDIKSINPRTSVKYIDDLEEEIYFKEKFMSDDNPENTSLAFKTNLKLSMYLIGFFSVIIILLEFHNIYNFAQSVATVFLSILMQAIPFILLGAFISAGIQIFSSSNWIIRQISKGKWYSFGIAAFAGFFMPVCDCGMVPIISGLLKKNLPLPVTMTFWLSSSAVSPVVIISMMYAFPEKPYLAIVRVVIGLSIGIITGIILKIARIKTEDVIIGSGRAQSIGKDILELKYQGIKGKIEAVFSGALVEFFRVAEYVIVGALISSILQTFMPHALKSLIGQSIIIQLLLMVIAAIFMSTCSTSNAFIGRSFTKNIAISPVMAFVVLGPMLDFKNMVMLSEILKKKFLLLLVGIIIIEATIIFGILSMFI